MRYVSIARNSCPNDMYTICCGERKFLFVYLVAYVFLVIDNEIIVLGKTCLSRILRFWSSVSSTRSTRGSQIMSILIRPLSAKKTSSQPSQASQKVLNLWKIDKTLSSWQIRVDSWKRVWIKSDCGRFGRRKENVPSTYQSGKEGQRREIFKTNLKICAIL